MEPTGFQGRRKGSAVRMYSISAMTVAASASSAVRWWWCVVLFGVFAGAVLEVEVAKVFVDDGFFVRGGSQEAGLFDFGGKPGLRPEDAEGEAGDEEERGWPMRVWASIYFSAPVLRVVIVPIVGYRSRCRGGCGPAWSWWKVRPHRRHLMVDRKVIMAALPVADEGRARPRLDGEHKHGEEELIHATLSKPPRMGAASDDRTVFGDEEVEGASVGRGRWQTWTRSFVDHDGRRPAHPT